MYPFVFNPFGRNNTVNILDLVIPKNHKLLTWLDSLLMIVELRKRA